MHKVAITLHHLVRKIGGVQKLLGDVQRLFYINTLLAKCILVQALFKIGSTSVSVIVSQLQYELIFMLIGLAMFIQIALVLNCQ